jgi:hypothetical protein
MPAIATSVSFGNTNNYVLVAGTWSILLVLIMLFHFILKNTSRLWAASDMKFLILLCISTIIITVCGIGAIGSSNLDSLNSLSIASSILLYIYFFYNYYHNVLRY